MYLCDAFVSKGLCGEPAEKLYRLGTMILGRCKDHPMGKVGRFPNGLEVREVSFEEADKLLEGRA